MVPTCPYPCTSLGSGSRISDSFALYFVRSLRMLMPLPQPSPRDELRRFLEEFHSGAKFIDDQIIDTMIGLNREATESVLSLGTLLTALGQHRMELGDLSYTVIRDLY